MSALNVVLTLPGIAGIVLSLAMAVDGNVLIYERIREELTEGQSFKAAVGKGFSNAFSAILDGNVTTFITGVLLFLFGTGPIAGFAITLMIGIATTLVSVLLVTRILLEWFMNRPGASEAFTKEQTTIKRYFVNAKYRFIPRRKVSYAVFAVVSLVCLASFFGVGFKTGIDFQGGRQYTVQFPAGAMPNTDAIGAALTPNLGGNTPLVREIGLSNQMLITTSYKFSNADADDEVSKAVLTSLASFGVEQDAEKSIVRQTKVGPTVADDIKEGAIKAVIFSLLAVFLYIFARFGRWQFGLGALVSLMFNMLATLGLFSLLSAIPGLPFSVEIDQNIIAALLTIVGYTINDTVVVFDRIREDLRADRVGEAPEVLFNRAINTTLSRTVITAGTVILSALILFFFGGDVLKGFMLSIIFGVVVGTFSSIFLASPLALDLALNPLRREAKARAAGLSTTQKRRTSKDADNSLATA
jgi:SecD/SecF fusion protein